MAVLQRGACEGAQNVLWPVVRHVHGHTVGWVATTAAAKKCAHSRTSQWRQCQHGACRAGSSAQSVEQVTLAEARHSPAPGALKPPLLWAPTCRKSTSTQESSTTYDKRNTGWNRHFTACLLALACLQNTTSSTVLSCCHRPCHPA
jgi:hypothetical protein